jgi:hypothetical protein
MSKPIWVALNSNGSILGTSLLRKKDDPDFGETWVEYVSMADIGDAVTEKMAALEAQRDALSAALQSIVDDNLFHQNEGVPANRTFAYYETAAKALQEVKNDEPIPTQDDKS